MCADVCLERSTWPGTHRECRAPRMSFPPASEACSYAEGLLPGRGELGRVGFRHTRGARVDGLDVVLVLERLDRRLDAEVCHAERRLGHRGRGLTGLDELGHLRVSVVAEDLQRVVLRLRD